MFNLIASIIVIAICVLGFLFAIWDQYHTRTEKSGKEGEK